MELKALTGTPPWEWPRDAPEVLMKTLRDPRSNPSDKLMAANLAADLSSIDDEMANALLEVVRNPAEPEQVRARAAIGLGPVLETTDIEGFDDDFSEPPIERETFDNLQHTLHSVLDDEAAPKEVRRRALEASVRAPQDWHVEAVRKAYASGDELWKLTAVFAMRWVKGFDKEIMESLNSRNPEIHLEAVYAAGSQEVEPAFPHVAALVTAGGTSKELLLAAIEAVASIRPHEAGEILADLAVSEDEDIAAAVDEALMMADADPDIDEEEDEDDEDEDDEDDEDEEGEKEEGDEDESDDEDEEDEDEEDEDEEAEEES
jgi:hypothetical protein